MAAKQITACLGYQQITSLSSAVGLTVPTVDAKGTQVNPTWARIRCTTQAVRYRDDGVNPTASVGFPMLVADQWIDYTGDLKTIKFIEQTASAVLEVLYYA